MSARDDILGRVRANLGRTPANADAARTAVADALAHPTRGPQIDFDRTPGALLARFIARSEAMASTVDRVAARSDVPAAVRRYLDSQHAGPTAVAWPALRDIEWQSAGLSVAFRAVTGDDAVGITGAWCAVAETGTLLLVSGVETPGATSLVPETHIAIVNASDVVATMEDAFDRARKAFGSLPRALNFVSGPSRTADIEQTIVLGAHGPCRVHLIVVGAMD